jgi:hypothetical protein
LRGDAERDVSLQLCAGCAQDSELKLCGPVQSCLVEPGLADPGVPLDQQGLPATFSRAFERSVEQLEHRLSLEQPQGSPLGTASAIPVRKTHTRH